ncbi:unnamed protein product [Sphagnum balticum]
MNVVQEKASQGPEQSHSREDEGQSSKNNNEEKEEQQQQERRHFSDLSRTFSLFPGDEISNDLGWHQQSGALETFNDTSHVTKTLIIDDEISSLDASSSSSQGVGNQAPLVAHYDVSSSTTENTQFAGMSRDAEDWLSNVPSKPAAKLACVKRSVPQRLMIENLTSRENLMRSPSSCIVGRKRRMSDPGTLVMNLDRVSTSMYSETPTVQTPRWDSWQEFAIVNSPTTPAGVETEQTSQKLKELIRYLPKLLLRKALSDPDTVATQPAIDVFQAAVLIADITGFTPLTERALTSKRGSELVEELTVSMNNYFDEAIELVLKYGGDITKLGGYGHTSNKCNNQEEEDCSPRASTSSTRIKGTFDSVHVLVADGLVLNRVVLSRMLGKLNCKDLCKLHL